MIILFLLITLPIILLYYLHQNSKPVKTLLPPGPPQWPFIGNLHQLGGSGDILHLHLWQLSKKYGPIFHMKLGSVPIIVISSSKLAKEVLKTQDLSFCSRPKLLVPQKLSYNFQGIVFSSYNNNWKEVRKITVTHLFSTTKIQCFRPIRDDEISIMVEKISRFATSSQVGALEEALYHFGSMTKDFGITLGLDHLGCLVTLYARKGETKTTYDLVKNFPCAQNDVMLKSLLSGCVMHKDLDLARLAAEEILSIDPNDGFAYVMMSNLYASLNMWEEASKVKELMKEKKVKRKIGCSWILD